MSNDTQAHTVEKDVHEPHPAVYELTEDDLPALVRYQGANAVLDAVLTVAAEVYGDEAVPKVHELLLRRATTVTPPAGGEC